MKLDKIQENRINQLLADHYGIDTITGKPMWRLTWANDELEIRHGIWDDYCGHIFLRRVTETREVKKYDADYKDKYVLEHLVIIPIINESDLPLMKQSYEPLWTFDNARNGQSILPTYDACVFICDTVLASMGHGSLAKYKEKFKDENPSERVDKLVKELSEGDTYLDGVDSKVFLGDIKQ